MSTKWIWLGFALVAAGGTGTVWRVREQTAATERARASAERQIARLREERQSLHDRLARSNRVRAKTDAELSKVEAARRETQTKPATSSSGATTPGDGRPSTRKRADVWERSIRREPELQALRLVADRAQRAIEFEAFFRKCGLSSEQIARFQEIASAYDEAKADIDAAIGSQDLAEDDPSVERLRQAARGENDAQLGTLLGANGLQQLREFEKTLVLRSAVRGFAAVALEAGVPLSASQAEQLAESLLRSRNTTVEGKVPNWNAVDDDARGFLHPDQLALLQRVEPNAHGAGGRRWLALQEIVAEARVADEKIARKF